MWGMGNNFSNSFLNSITINYLYNKLSSIKSLNSFLDEIFFVKNLNLIENSNLDISKFKFIFFYKKWFLLNDFYFYILDVLFIKIYYFIFKKNSLVFFKNNAINLKLQQTNNNFIYNFSNKTYSNNLNLFSFGLQSIWKSIRFWVLGVIIALVVVYYCLVIKLLPFTKIVFQWFILTMFFYWLVSGFVFFFKKYQYRYFTSSIQRFWRRSFTIFWAIEGCVFVVFLYLTVNANQEPVYMYDNSQIYKTHLFSWRYFLIKIFPVTLLVIFSYFILVSLKWNIYNKSNILCLLLTALLLFIVWQEFYQFFHLVGFYGNLSWVYDLEDHLWNLEVEFRRTRIVNHYVTICLIAKFWHLIFVLIFWLFFVFRSLELGRIRYPLFSANHQNFLIIYVLSWAYMYPWFKFIIKKFLEMPYFWFYVNTRKLGIFIFFNDFKLFYLSISNTFSDFLTEIFNLNSLYHYHFNNCNFFYWHSSSNITGYSQVRKNYIRDSFITNIYN